jgi:hypothetical protein
MTAVVTTLSGITYLASETAACQVVPQVVDPTSMTTEMINEFNQLILKLNQLIALVPAGTNLTALNAVLTKINT